MSQWEALIGRQTEETMPLLLRDVLTAMKDVETVIETIICNYDNDELAQIAEALDVYRDQEGS